MVVLLREVGVGFPSFSIGYRSQDPSLDLLLNLVLPEAHHHGPTVDSSSVGSIAWL
jgi:hypothetical protein